MSAGPADIYHAQIIRAVVGGQPVIIGRENDPAALRRICERLVEYEEALAILTHKGYGKLGDSITDIAKALPVRPKPPELHDIWSSR